MPSHWERGTFLEPYSTDTIMRDMETFFFTVTDAEVADKSAVSLRDMDMEPSLVNLRELVMRNDDGEAEVIGYHILSNVKSVLRTPMFLAIGKVPQEGASFDKSGYIPLKDMQLFKMDDSMVFISTRITPYWESVEHLF